MNEEETKNVNFLIKHLTLLIQHQKDIESLNYLIPPNEVLAKKYCNLRIQKCLTFNEPLNETTKAEICNDYEQKLKDLNEGKISSEEFSYLCSLPERTLTEEEIKESYYYREREAEHEMSSLSEFVNFLTSDVSVDSPIRDKVYAILKKIAPADFNDPKSLTESIKYLTFNLI